jgi:hypothetical protein
MKNSFHANRANIDSALLTQALPSLYQQPAASLDLSGNGEQE